MSCRFFETPLRDLRERGIDPRRLVEGTGLTPEALADKDERVAWSTLLQTMQNARKLWTHDELLRLGGRSTEGPLVQFIGVVARIRFSVLGFYQWVTAVDGVASQMITCVKTTSRTDGPGRLIVDFHMEPDHPISPEFFLITQGTYAAMPRMLGANQAEVIAVPISDGVRFHIQYVEPRGVLSTLRRVATWPFTARQAAVELADAHASLIARYDELEQARAKLEAYQANLELLVDQRTAELADTVAQLREAQGARERFFGNISHEIRTPLSLILLAVADVEARAGHLLDPRSRAGLGAVNDAARKLVRLVDELLLLAAGQEDKLVLHPEPTDLAALIEHLAAAWLPAAEAAGIALATRVPSRLVASVDPVAIERVASNLVSNAVKYTPRGGAIELELVEIDAAIRLSILDTGPGIADELASRLFGRFERTSGEGRRKQGSGLGLSLVKQLVEAHGGTVAAVARPEQGSELRVTLPASLVLRDTVAPRAQLTLGTDAAVTIASGTRFDPPGVSAGTILIAEDDGQLAETIARRLADTYTVIVALDGEAAVELVARHQPQLLITDVDMPGMSGIELAARFREVSGDRLAPIIILSAVIDLRSRIAGLEAGAVDYVTKPFDAHELEARVAAQFRMRELGLRLHRAEQLSSLGILTSGLAHEIRNPANGIVNAIAPLLAQLPRELTHPDSDVGQLLEIMGSCAEQIGALSQQLLGFRDGRLELRPARIPELVGRAVSLARPALVGVEVSSELTLEHAVMCAPPLLVQVLVNLIENAAHSAGAGGWVRIAGSADGERLSVEVSDSGPGVPIELRERVFEPFFTTKPPGAGTGLGLPLSRAIIHRHGGVLEIRDRGSRAVFVVELPHSKPNPADAV